MNWNRWYNYLVKKFGVKNVKTVKAEYTETLSVNIDGKWIPIYYDYVNPDYRCLVMITVKNLALSKKNLETIIKYHRNICNKLKVKWKNNRASLDCIYEDFS